MIRSITPVAEMKYIDTSFGSYVPTYSFGAISSFTTPGVGTGRSNRIGDVIKYKRLEVRGQYYGAVSHMVRMIIFHWKPNTTASGADVLDSTYVNTFRAPFAPYNFNQKDSFQILLDTHFVISATGKQNDIFKFDLKLKGVSKFDASASTGTNRIYGLWVSDGVVTLGTLDMVFRVHYVDDV